MPQLINEYNESSFGAGCCMGVPAKHVDIPNAYVKAGKEDQLDIFLSSPVRIQMNKEMLRSLGVQSTTISFFR